MLMWRNCLGLLAGATFFGVMFVCAALQGYFAYSPIPWWDMWDGFIGFILRLDGGDYSAWIAFHNEHRILLSRILFYLGGEFFGGSSVFFVITNYLMAFFSSWVWWLIFGEVFDGEGRFSLRRVVATFVVSGYIFSWIQDSNFWWGFQSQFHLAQSLPLLSFYLISRAADGSRFYALAVVSGVASVFTMANGIFVLPLVSLCAALFNLGRLKVVFLLVVSIVSCALYFRGFRVSPDGGGGLSSVVNDPVGFVRFVLVYMGGPFFHAFKWAGAGGAGAALVGGGGYLFFAANGFCCYAKGSCQPFLWDCVCFRFLF